MALKASVAKAVACIRRLYQWPVINNGGWPAMASFFIDDDVTMKSKSRTRKWK